MFTGMDRRKEAGAASTELLGTTMCANARGVTGYDDEDDP
jgi:hypothetical protein